MKSIIATLLLFAALTASAHAEYEGKKFDSIDVSLRSYHFNDRCWDHCSKKFNEANYGLGATIQMMDNMDIVLGFLSNSFEQTSIYQMFNFTMTPRYYKSVAFKPGLALGLASGYDNTLADIGWNGLVPVISPNLSMYVGRLHFNVGVLPNANTVVGIFRAGVRF